ncbi:MULTISPECIES: hypothetical protein [unclassified Candidatus Frackibacter]|uniref:hypothetical protein n=1 Tax=unclassified Candidatus Frackibacter TaxID=2648818 RepID=UPI0008882EA4|nr:MULTISPECIES: hypothetical protein [unclassified Candidatus Frackibacter]SDC11064.1 hypothetical protein SAMN04515661_102134 [Candidatus Frackibacter sp. WG11]SEM36731.1 hypothetical protein SAMN04488698_10277 [Candidatus Frackibacter sp. WG12]SFL42075.1 hypothetical protein SAMN04488699_10277 [Candidatus Frackibacter sp. WG13]
MRLTTRYLTLFLILIFASQFVMAGQSGELIKGKIVAVNVQQGVFLVKSGNNLKEYRVNIDTRILRNGASVSLSSLRPVTVQDFQPALIRLNEKGEVMEVRVEYDVLPIQVKDVNYAQSRIKLLLLNSNTLLEFNYNSKMNLVRNSQQVMLKSLKVGDQGLVVLGLNNQIEKVQVRHYEY